MRKSGDVSGGASFRLSGQGGGHYCTEQRKEVKLQLENIHWLRWPYSWKIIHRGEITKGGLGIRWIAEECVSHFVRIKLLFFYQRGEWFFWYALFTDQGYLVSLSNLRTFPIKHDPISVCRKILFLFWRTDGHDVNSPKCCPPCAKYARPSTVGQTFVIAGKWECIRKLTSNF